MVLVADKGSIAVSENARAYSAAVIADAQASIMRSVRGCDDAASTCKRAKQYRESIAGTKSSKSATPQG